MAETKLYDFAAELCIETPRAYLVDAGLEEKVWLPKTLTEKHDDGTFTIPEWLAVEKGIV